MNYSWSLPQAGGVLQIKKDVKVNAKPLAGQPQHGEVEVTGALMRTSIGSSSSSDVRLLCDFGEDVLSDPQLPHLYNEEVPLDDHFFPRCSMAA